MLQPPKKSDKVLKIFLALMDMKKAQSGRKHYNTSKKLQIIEECNVEIKNT